MQDVTFLRMDSPRCSNGLCCRILPPLFSVSPLVCCEILMAKRGALMGCPGHGGWGWGDSCRSVCLMDSSGKPQHVLTLAAVVGHEVLHSSESW